MNDDWEATDAIFRLPVSCYCCGRLVWPGDDEAYLSAVHHDENNVWESWYCGPCLDAVMAALFAPDE